MNCLNNALEKVKTEGFRLLELRPRGKSVQEVVTGDYDFVIAQNDFAPILSTFIESALNTGVHVEVSRASENKRVLYLVSQGERVKLEFWLNIEIASHTWGIERIQISGSRVFEYLEKAPQEELVVLAALYLTHLNFKNKTLESPLQQYRLSFFLRKLGNLPSSAAKNLESVYLHILQSAKYMGEVDLREPVRFSLNLLASKGIVTEKTRFRSFRTLVRRLSTRKNLIPVIGPDGAGKTYLCQNLISSVIKGGSHFRFKRYFRNLEYGFVIRIMRQLLPAEKQNELDERISGYLIVKSWLILKLMAPKMKIARRPILVDRYGWDYLVQGIKTADTPRRIKFHSIFSKLISKPKKCVCVIAHTATIMGRKDELTEEKIDFIYAEYFRLASTARADSFFFYNSQVSFEFTREDLSTFIEANEVKKLASN